MMCRTRLVLKLLPLLLVGCATAQPAESTADCAEVLARHRANPALDVDVPPRARSMRTMKVPMGGTGGGYRVTFVVDETGHVDPGGLQVVPTPPDIEEFRRGYANSRYVPARVGDCPVPARVSVRLGS